MRPVTYHSRREMGYSRREFLKALPAAIDHRTVEAEGNTLTILLQAPDQIMRIQLGEERVRKIALLALPILDVEITIEGVEGDALRQIVRRFDLALQKGGG